MAQWKAKVPGVLKLTVPLVAPAAMVPVLQAPVLEVAVCGAPVLLVQLTAEPAVTVIGFGLKHQVVAAQLTICAADVAANAAVAPATSITAAIDGRMNTLRIALNPV